MAVRRATLTALKVLMFAAIAVLIAVLPRFMGEFRLSQFTFVAIYFISLLGLNILAASATTGRSRSATARSWGSARTSARC